MMEYIVLLQILLSVFIPFPHLYTTTPISKEPNFKSENWESQIQLLGNSHPRLYFTNEDIPLLREKINEEPTATYWKWMQNDVKSISELPVSIENSSDQYIIYRALRHGSFIYAVSGDEKIGKKAKDWLMQTCSYPSWTRSERLEGGYLVDYYTGKIAIVVGESYDWLYPLLDESERKIVRTAIIEKAVKPANTMYTMGYYEIKDAYSNRAAQAYGGIGVAALVILGDDPSEPVAQYFNGTHVIMKEYIETWGRDGGWHEGIGYQIYGLCDVSGGIYYIDALNNVLGENYYENKNFSNSLYFPIYMLSPDRQGISDSFGDQDFSAGFTKALSARYSSAYGNEYAQWYFNHADSVYGPNLAGLFIWYDSSTLEKNPNLLYPTKHFRDIGWVVMRTGWNEQDTLIVFKSGIAYKTAHKRPEQNSFILDAWGERLIIEPGMPSGGYDDPTYFSYHRATISQNTILINGDPHSQDETGTLNGSTSNFLTSNFYDAVRGNAADVYKGNLKKFDRYIVFIRPDYLVIFDNLESAIGPVKFDSLFHTIGSDTITVEDNLVTITQPNVKLDLVVLSPEEFLYDINAGEPVNLKNGQELTSYISISPSNQATDMSFSYLLYPRQYNEPIPSVMQIRDGNTIGMKMTRDNVIDILVFNPEKTGISIEGFVTDGDQAFIRHRNGTVEGFAMHNGNQIIFNGINLYYSENQCSVVQSVQPYTPVSGFCAFIPLVSIIAVIICLRKLKY